MTETRTLGKWWVCGLLLLALMLNYMDRQTLSLTIGPIKKELELTPAHYGRLEKGFGYAFAFGGIIAGFVADRVNVRWFYPFVLTGWSLAGIATGFADRIGKIVGPPLMTISQWMSDIGASLYGHSPEAIDANTPGITAYWGFMTCRVLLGLFEAGQWPCALITTSRLLSSADRPFGNSVLQSGASIGAILTPQVVQLLVVGQGAWRYPFVLVGIAGLFWIVPWLWMTRGLNLSRIEAGPDSNGAPIKVLPSNIFWWRYIALIGVVITINLPWHFFRAWMPLMLQEYHGYEDAFVRHFNSAYYIGTDIGCISAGFMIRWLISKGSSVHRARLWVFAGCTLLTMGSVIAAQLPKGPLLLGLLLLFGFGSLGLFPIYYSLTQELSSRHQGKVTGSLSFITWVVTAEMQALVGQHVNETKSYSSSIFWIGLVPLVGLAAMLLCWREEPPTADAPHV